MPWCRCSAIDLGQTRSHRPHPQRGRKEADRTQGNLPRRGHRPTCTGSRGRWPFFVNCEKELMNGETYGSHPILFQILIKTKIDEDKEE